MLYHGTRRGFSAGGYLFPRSHHGGAKTAAPVNEGRVELGDRDEWVYMTTSLDLAWAYAWAAPGRGRPKVLVVRPAGVIEPDPEHSPQMGAWRTEMAKVTSVLTEPTMTEQEALTGWKTGIL